MPKSKPSLGASQAQCQWACQAPKLRKQNEKGLVKSNAKAWQVAGLSRIMAEACQVLRQVKHNANSHVKHNGKGQAKQCQRACQAMELLKHNAKGQANQCQGRGTTRAWPRGMASPLAVAWCNAEGRLACLWASQARSHGARPDPCPVERMAMPWAWHAQRGAVGDDFFTKVHGCGGRCASEAIMTAS